MTTEAKPARSKRRRAERPDATGSARRTSARADPRLTARKVAVARHAGRRRLWVLVGLVGIAAAISGGLAIVHSSLFSARHVEITGAVHTSKGEILSVTGLDERPPLIDVNTSADESLLDALPFVASATVVRRWPSSVDITITERVGVAVVTESRHAFAVLDSEGRVLEVVRSAPVGLVTVGGVRSVPEPGGVVAGAETPLFAIAGSLTESLAARVTEVEQSPSQGVIVRLAHGPEAIFGTTADLREKVVSLATLLADQSALVGVSTIDLAEPSSPVLTP